MISTLHSVWFRPAVLGGFGGMSDRSFDIFHPFVSPVREAVGEGVSISTYMCICNVVSHLVQTSWCFFEVLLTASTSAQAFLTCVTEAYPDLACMYTSWIRSQCMALSC
jgi:hypothetical protein